MAVSMERPGHQPEPERVDPAALVAQFERAAVFEHFLRDHVWLPDATANETIRWEWWPVHRDMVRDLAHRRLIVLKARQIGWSWLLAAYAAHQSMFRPHFSVLVFSIGQKESEAFLAKCRFIIEHLPSWLRPRLSKNNSEVIEFQDTESSIRALPSTEHAGSGYTASLVIVDEAAKHPHAEANYAAYNPTVSAGGQLIIVSTAQGMGNWYHRMWEGARSGRNGFVARFYPWSVRPGRDAAWYEQQRAEYNDNPSQLSQEHPAAEDEAFALSGSPRFNMEVVLENLREARPPLRVRPDDLPERINRLHLARTSLRIWSLPRPGVPYVAYIEPAEGKGRDYTVSVILEARTLRHVLTLRDNVLEPGEHTAIFLELCYWYGKPLLGFERARGEAVAHQIGADGYDRLYWHEEGRTLGQHISATEPVRRLGLPVTQQTRRGLIDELAQVIADRELASDDTEFWRECTTFVVNEHNRPEAASGAHDDLVMAMAGAVRMAAQPGAQTVRERTRAREYSRTYGRTAAAAQRAGRGGYRRTW